MHKKSDGVPIRMAGESKESRVLNEAAARERLRKRLVRINQRDEFRQSHRNDRDPFTQ